MAAQRQLQTPIRIIETVRVGTVADVMERELSVDCHVQTLAVSPADSGYGICSRPRVYHIAVVRQKGRFLRNVQEVYDELCASLAGHQVKSDGAWFETEEAELSKKRACVYDSSRGLSSLGFWAGLTPFEKAHAVAYNENWAQTFHELAKNNGTAVFTVGRSPKFTWASTLADKGALPTFTASPQGKRLWSPSQNRWLTAKEKPGP